MPSSLISMNDNVLAAVDVETTGREPWTHEIVQIAIVPLDCHIKPVGKPFYTNINPVHPERMSREAIAAHGITLDQLQDYPDPHTVGEQLWDWFQDLKLPPKKRLIPLIHNSQFDIPFIQRWLGYELFNDIFGYPTRDTAALAASLIDKAAFKSLNLPFSGRVNLGHLCNALGIELDNAHDALADAVATASVYRTLLHKGNW